MRLTIEAKHETLPLAQTFAISRGAKTQADVVVVTVTNGEFTGWGESVPYARYGQSIEGTLNKIKCAKPAIKHIDDHQRLNTILPACAARNALDCALWDLKSKIENKPVAQLIDLQEIKSCVTAQTVSVASIQEMQKNARALRNSELIKVKLDPDDVIEKVSAIHEVCPDSRFIIDANEGWSLSLLKEVAPQLARLNVALIEQPLPADDDEGLTDYQCPVPLCADESCHTTASLKQLVGKYQAINIKLDKTGGLTEARSLMKAAGLYELDIMVGCMVASSLAMAPAYLLAGGADYIDLDGPVLVAEDRQNGFIIENGIMKRPDSLLWGSGR